MIYFIALDENTAWKLHDLVTYDYWALLILFRFYVMHVRCILMLNKVNGIKVLILLQTIIFIIVNIFYQKEVRLDQVSELNFNLIKKKHKSILLLSNDFGCD